MANVIVCNHEPTRFSIETKSIVTDQFGFILNQIKFVQNGANFYIGPEVLDDPLYQFDELQEYGNDPDNISEYPIPVIPPEIPDNTAFDDIPVTDNIQYSLASIENKGTLAKSTTLSEAYLIKKPNNEIFITLIYRNTGEIIVVDTQTNLYYYFDTVFQKAWKPVYHATTNSIVYICASSQDVFRFSLTSFSLEYNTGPVTANFNSIMQDRCLGTDGNIYIGAAIGGRVFRYVPTTDVLTTYPVIDSNPGTIVNNVGGDANYIYAVLRNTGNYRLCVFNQTTTTPTYHKTYSDGYKYGEVLLYRETASGQIFWQVRLVNSTTAPEFTMKIQNGVEVSYAADELLTPELGGSESSNSSYTTWPDRFGWEIDLEDIEGINSPSVFRYRNVVEEVFRELTLTEIQGEDFLTQVFEPMADGNIVGVGSQYGPCYILDTSNDTVSQIYSLNQMSSYSAKDDSGNIYIGGYVDSTYRWNPEQTFDFGTNPYKINLSAQNSYYHRAYAIYGDWLYVMQDITRNDVGGAIGIYNVSTEQIINASNTQKTTIRNWNVGDLIVVGNYLAYIGNPRSGASTTPRVFIWNLTTDTNINNVTPTEVNVAVDQINGGKAFAISSTEFVAIQADVIYKVNVSSGSISYFNIPGTVSNLRGIVQKENGHILFISGNFLYDLNPVVMTAEKISSSLGTNKNRTMAYVDGQIYLIAGDSSYSSPNSKYYLEKLIL